MTRADVARALAKLDVPAQQTLEAFQLSDGWDLRAGSGIAGQNYAWFLWHAREGGNGEKTAASAKTVAELKQLLAQKNLLPPQFDVQHNAYGRRICSRCSIIIRAPVSRMPHVFWMHDTRCRRATPDERASFLRTGRWPFSSGGGDGE